MSATISTSTHCIPAVSLMRMWTARVRILAIGRTRRFHITVQRDRSRCVRMELVAEIICPLSYCSGPWIGVQVSTSTVVRTAQYLQFAHFNLNAMTHSPTALFTYLLRCVIAFVYRVFAQALGLGHV